MNYTYIPYNPIFPTLFSEEKLELVNIVGDKAKIEHIGSTAVPGLGGKGVIDIYVLVPQETMVEISQKLQKHGYKLRPHGGEKDRLFHQIDKLKYGSSIHFHIHLSHFGNMNFKKCIAFRDYLRTHPDFALQYAQVKKHASQHIKSLKDKGKIKKIYTEIKGPFIEAFCKSLPFSE